MVHQTLPLYHFSLLKSSYQWTKNDDYSSLKEASYYRLTQVDNNGTNLKIGVESCNLSHYI